MPSVTKMRAAGLLFGLWLVCTFCQGQDLAPRAYLITPVDANAITLTFSYFNGNIEFNQALPITDASGNPKLEILSAYHALNFLGHSSNITAFLPYGFGNFEGNVNGKQGTVYRSGLLDAVFRFSVNLKGGPAMSPKEFRSWRQKTLIGASITVVAPTGQYDPTRLINQSSNRWALKPELGFSRRWGQWVVDAYGGVWFFTTNPEFFSHNQLNPGTVTQSQKPVGAFEGHLSYDVKHNRRFWVSLDGNFWFGGRTSLNGVENALTLERNSRIGATIAMPITNHQALKFSFSDGAYIRYGGNYQNVSAAWQYSWLGKPR
jgi:hypothetical protein